MSRGELTHDELKRVAAKLPDLSRASGLITPLAPDTIALAFSHDSDVPIAAVCLNDARQRTSEIALALHEYHAHRIWYREKKSPPEPMAATWTERFFLDDAALRIYGAWQHLRMALRYMETIPRGWRAPFKRPRDDPRSYEGLYLEHEQPNLSVTVKMCAFEKSPAWSFVVKYRNAWVHQQPPTIAGLGMVFTRRRRWEPLARGAGIRLTGGGSDPPEHTIDELHEAVDAAFRGYLEALEAAAQRYREILGTAGITVDVPNCTLRVRLFA
jgi:hypothetical protein